MTKLTEKQEQKIAKQNIAKVTEMVSIMESYFNSLESLLENYEEYREVDSKRLSQAQVLLDLEVIKKDILNLNETLGYPRLLRGSYRSRNPFVSALNKKKPSVNKVYDFKTNKAVQSYLKNGLKSKTLKEIYEILKEYKGEKRLALTLVLANRKMNGAPLSGGRGYAQTTWKKSILDAAETIQPETIDRYLKAIGKLGKEFEIGYNGEHDFQDYVTAMNKKTGEIFTCGSSSDFSYNLDENHKARYWDSLDDVPERYKYIFAELFKKYCKKFGEKE